jgi:SNF2 family DNA or RNA helicase
MLWAEMISKVLVLAPLRVARSTWPEDAAKWKHTAHLNPTPIVGSLSERRAALKASTDVFTTNYEQLPWLIEEFGDAWPFDCVVADELTRLKSYRSRQGGKRAGAFARIAHSKVKRFIGLTGTPAPNGLNDLYGQVFFLDAGNRLGRTHTAFTQRWFRALPNGGNKHYQKLEPMPHAQEEIQALLRDICLTLDPKDWFDLEAPIVRTVPVALPAKARQHYREMERAMFTELEGHEIEAFSAAAKTMKTLQFANGAAYVGETNSEWVVVHDEKIDALESIIAEAGGAPVLVAYHFRSDLARLQKRFPAARILDAKPKTLEEWNAGRIPLLLAHPASAGHGLNLQHGGNILVFFGLNWNLEEHLQIIERIGPVRQKQSGYSRPVFVYHIVAKGTIDELVLERLQSKRSVQDILLSALKRYREDQRTQTAATN